jgi:hypothetical protein
LVVVAQKTRVWRPEDSVVEIYTHVEDEILSGAIPGSIFTFANTPVSVTGIGGTTALAQYADATGSIARQDVLIKLRKDGADTEWNTASVAGSITGASVIFSASIAAAMADNIVACYSHTKVDKSLETVEVAESGGERAVEYITVYSGKRIALKKVQGPVSVDITILKSDLGFAEIVNGEHVLQVLSGTGSITYARGGQTRLPRTLVVKDTDPENSNQLLFVYYNVLGVTKGLGGAAEDHFTETVSLNCAAEDKNEIHIAYTG